MAILKSAWQLAKEISTKHKLDVNVAKVEIIRAGKKGLIKEYTYQKDGQSVNLYEESQVREAFDLGRKLKNYQVNPTSYQLNDGQWVPQLEVIEDLKSEAHVLLWQWPSRRFPTQEAANKYAKFCGLQKLRRMVD